MMISDKFFWKVLFMIQLIILVLSKGHCQLILVLSRFTVITTKSHN